MKKNFLKRFGFGLSDEEKREILESHLKKPDLPPFSEALAKTKRNLLLVSSVSAYLGLTGLKIKSFALLGIQFSNFREEYVILGLIMVQAYLLSMFCLYVWGYGLRNRLILTSADWKSYFYADPSENGDRAWPRNKSLHTFWLELRRDYAGVLDIAKILDEAQTPLQEEWEREMGLLAEQIARLKKLGLQSSEVEIRDALSNIGYHEPPSAEYLKGLRGKIVGAAKSIEDTMARPVEEHMRRFDQEFWLFFNMQSFRVYGMEIVLPAGLAVWSLCMMLDRVF